MNKLLSSIRSFAIEEDGAQVIEYALIIAVVSLALILLMMNGFTFQAWIDRVNTCLTAPELASDWVPSEWVRPPRPGPFSPPE